MDRERVARGKDIRKSQDLCVLWQISLGTPPLETLGLRVSQRGRSASRRMRLESWDEGPKIEVRNFSPIDPMVS